MSVRLLRYTKRLFIGMSTLLKQERLMFLEEPAMSGRYFEKRMVYIQLLLALDDIKNALNNNYWTHKIKRAKKMLNDYESNKGVIREYE